MKDLLGDTVHHIRFPLPIKLHSALYKSCNWVGCHYYHEAKRGERRNKTSEKKENDCDGSSRGDDEQRQHGWAAGRRIEREGERKFSVMLRRDDFII